MTTIPLLNPFYANAPFNNKTSKRQIFWEQHLISFFEALKSDIKNVMGPVLLTVLLIFRDTARN